MSKIRDTIDHLCYTHPVPHHIKEVFKTLIEYEDHYLDRIEELENVIKLLQSSKEPEESPKDENLILEDTLNFINTDMKERNEQTLWCDYKGANDVKSYYAIEALKEESNE